MKKYDLKKKEILRRKKDFINLFQKGKVIHGHYINLIYGEAKERKVGFAVSKKVKKAVQRNKLKRILRELYRTHKDQISTSNVLVLLAKDDGVSMDFQSLKEDFEGLLDEIK